MRHRSALSQFRCAKVHAIVPTSRASSRFRMSGITGGAGESGTERGATAEGAVVVTVTVTLVEELPNVAGLGDTVQVAREGTPVQVKVTWLFNPPSPPNVKV